MKDIIRKILKEETEEVFDIPSIEIFPDGVTGFLKFIKRHGHKKWSFDKSLDFYTDKNLKRQWEAMDFYGLDNLVGVRGELDLYDVNITNLDSLKFVNGDLDVRKTKIRSLDNLEYVGGILKVNNYIEENIRSSIEIGKLRVEGGLLGQYD